MISWFTGGAGSIGFPISYAAKGGDPATLSFWLMSGVIGLSCMSTTVIIIYVFRPYVYTIERVPIRKCHSPTKVEDNDSESTTAATKPTANQHYLYVATTRSLFLFTEQHFFDPATDLFPYSGITQPLCNLRVVTKNNNNNNNTATPDGSNTTTKEAFLYVHPEVCYDRTISKVLALPDAAAGNTVDPAAQMVVQERKNPDDQFKS